MQDLTEAEATAILASANEDGPSARSVWWAILDRVDTFTLARKEGIDHAKAVHAASSFCPNRLPETNGLGIHGSTSPCCACTALAIKVLASR